MMGQEADSPGGGKQVVAVERVCVLGGGTAGWMTAAALVHKFARLPISVTVVESDEIGTVGVGEATLPHIREFNRALDIDEAAFMRATHATFKLGIEFCDWGRIGDRYLHPFGDFGVSDGDVPFYQYWLRLLADGERPGPLGDYSVPVVAAAQGRFARPPAGVAEPPDAFGYAYQFDSALYGRLLRQHAERSGARRVEGKVVDVELDPENGFVRSILTQRGERIEADLFIDCSGFRGILIEQTLNAGYYDWRQWLPCDRAIAVPCPSRGELTPFTRATAMEAGWRWRIPLQHRVGNGHVYCSSLLSDDEAADQLLRELEAPPQAEPRQLFFTAGHRRRFWSRNVVAIGLSGGFLEPLESTSIHLIQEGITELLQLWPDKTFDPLDADEYNRRMALNFERVRDFLLLHYVATQRDDSEMWRHFGSMSLPDSLQEKIDAWMTRGYLLRYEFGVFLPPSWVAVMLGQNLTPRSYDPRAGRLPSDELRARAAAIREKVRAIAARLPRHDEYLHSCGAASGAAAANIAVPAS